LTCQTPQRSSHNQQQLDWLIKMAQTPGFRDYAMDKAKRMNESQFYRGIEKALHAVVPLEPVRKGLPNEYSRRN
jgi:hypothetical protein